MIKEPIKSFHVNPYPSAGYGHNTRSWYDSIDRYFNISERLRKMCEEVVNPEWIENHIRCLYTEDNIYYIGVRPDNGHDDDLVFVTENYKDIFRILKVGFIFTKKNEVDTKKLDDYIKGKMSIIDIFRNRDLVDVFINENPNFKMTRQIIIDTISRLDHVIIHIVQNYPNIISIEDYYFLLDEWMEYDYFIHGSCLNILPFIKVEEIDLSYKNNKLIKYFLRLVNPVIPNNDYIWMSEDDEWNSMEMNTIYVILILSSRKEVSSKLTKEELDKIEKISSSLK